MGASVIAAAEVGTLALALFALLGFALAVARLARLGFVFGGEAALFVAADAAVGVEPFEDELGGGGAHAIGLVFGEAERLRLLHEALNGVQLPDHGGGIDGLIELERTAEIEPFYDPRKIDALEVLVVDLADGSADQIAGHGIAAFELALVFQFELAGDGGERGVNVGDARHGGIVPALQGAALGVGYHVFEHGNGEALADAGALVDALVFARQEGQLFHHAADVIGHADFDGRRPIEPGFLLRDGDALLPHGGIVGGELVGDVLAAAGGLDGVDIADHVGDGDVRGGQLFDVALVAVEPRDGHVVRLIGHQIAAAAANGSVRVVVNFAAGQVRRPFVEQGGELADEAGFGLAAQSQENEVVARQDGVDHLGHDGILVSDDAGK